MDYSRRQFLSKSGTVLGGACLVSSAPVQAQGSDSGLPTPEAPEKSLDTVVSEAYGELMLSSERQFWPFEIESNSEEIMIEYEVQPQDGFYTPDVLMMSESGYNKYETKVKDYKVIDGPLLSNKTYDLGLLGRVSLPLNYNGENVHWDNIGKWRDSQQIWSDENDPMVRRHTLECFEQTATGRLHDSRVIDGGDYQVVFDWTDKVLDTHSEKRVSVDVAVRAVNPDLEKVEKESQAELKAVYTGLSHSGFVEAGKEFASTVCGGVPKVFHGNPADDLRDSVPETVQIVSAINAVLGIAESQLGYNASFVDRLTEASTSWARWSLSVLPVVSSLSQLVDDACSVTKADPDKVANEIENMLMSLGILVAGLLTAQFGVAGRAASFATGMARKYLLGFVARTLGLKAYVVLLRELYTLTRSGFSEALQAVKAITREIGREYDILKKGEVSRVKSMSEDDLEESSFDFGFLSLSPECHT